MKSTLNFTLFILALGVFESESLSLTDYKIKEFCRNERKKSICIKNLQEKKSNLEKGNSIEIPVIPYKR